MVSREIANGNTNLSMNTESTNHSGIYFMLIGMFMFTVNDAIGKWLVTDFSVGQLLAIRSWAALVILFPLLAKKGELTKLFKFDNPMLHCIRLFFVVMEASCFFWAVRYLPLADTFMIYLAAPIFVTALSPFMLGEKVGMFRWLAVLIGFGGVVLIFPPSEAALSLPATATNAGNERAASLGGKINTTPPNPTRTASQRNTPTFSPSINGESAVTNIGAAR